MGLDSETSNNSEQIDNNLQEFNSYEENINNFANQKQIKLNLIEEEDAKKINIATEKYAKNPQYLEKIIKTIEHSHILKQQNLDILNSRLLFLRPKKEFDIIERKWTYDNLSQEIKINCPTNLPLRFHGTSIYAAQEIIKNKALNSLADRVGFETDYSAEDQIWISSPSYCVTTIKGYSDLNADKYFLPAGCIFVFLPHSEEEAKDTENSLTMRSIDFKENPKLLFGLITSTENKTMVKNWMKQSNLDENLVSTFTEFPQKLSSLKDDLTKNPNLLNEILPYKSTSIKI